MHIWNKYSLCTNCWCKSRHWTEALYFYVEAFTFLSFFFLGLISKFTNHRCRWNCRYSYLHCLHHKIYRSTVQVHNHLWKLMGIQCFYQVWCVLNAWVCRRKTLICRGFSSSDDLTRLLPGGRVLCLMGAIMCGNPINGEHAHEF